MNYFEVPEFKAAVERINAVRAADPQSVEMMFLYQPGRKLQLDVEVTEPEIANVVLGSSFGPRALMPGMKITNIRFGDLEGKHVLIAWMKKQIQEMEAAP